MASASIDDLWTKLSPEAQRYIHRVIQIEKDKLHMSLPRGINEELIAALKEVVR